MSNSPSTSLDVRKQAAMEASSTSTPRNALRNALLVGFIIPPTECHRWADHVFPKGPHSQDPGYDPLIPFYLNYKFGQVVDDSILPFHIVANPKGAHDVMYVLDIRTGEWENPLANYNIEEVFDEGLQVYVDEKTLEDAFKFMKEDMSTLWGVPYILGLPLTH
jgi:hypothetical protein